MNVKQFISKVCKITMSNGDRCVGRIAEVDNDFITLVFRNGDTGYVAISDIGFIAPVIYQPEKVV